jgi:hypothetical protein
VVGPVKYEVEATGEDVETAAMDWEVEAAGRDVGAGEGGGGMIGGFFSSLTMCL